jgi:hypothetical protein
MKSLPCLCCLGVFAVLSLGAPDAGAAAPWVERSITLPRHDWAFNFGLGIAHVPGSLAPGLNIEAAAGVTSALQIGLRTGLRFDVPARAAVADVYGRLFDTETYGTGDEVVANPEFYLRGALINGAVVELGLEARAEAPFSRGLGLMVGIPLAFHFGRAARLDTGVYVPILFYNPTRSLVSFPFHLWFQTSDRLWLGPLVGVRVESDAPHRTEVPLGFGLGYSVTRSLDFKGWLLFQDVANRGDPPPWGFGGGIEVRVE